MDTIIVRVLDFAEAPGPRFISQGKFSGEEFYVTVLNGKMAQCLQENKQLVVQLDGTAGYPSSFLDQAFGELVYDFTLEVVQERVEIETVVNRRRRNKVITQTYPQWEQRRKAEPSMPHDTREFDLIYIDKEGNLGKRKR